MRIAAKSGLGIDAGGTQTRWALADASGVIVDEGSVGGLSATQLNHAVGVDAVRAELASLAAQARAASAVGQVTAICAGLSGFGGDGALVTGWLADLFVLPPQAVTLRSDIEIAYLDSFAPGEGYLVYAGTGSIAAFIAADGQFHRAGGRGVSLDDGGGGYWIAREAMRHIWRLEDEQPGVWRQSAMARAVFDQLGGSDWTVSRQFIYGQERGAIGRLALAIAASADADPVARAILEQAGRELARIALALVGRYGPRPVTLSGRAATLHPCIAQAMRAALPDGVSLIQRATQAHHAAARIALNSCH
jgi:N-acetylglucosamine kinase-like BadF-type ATPase